MTGNKIIKGLKIKNFRGCRNPNFKYIWLSYELGYAG